MEISTHKLQELIRQSFDEGFHCGAVSDFGDDLADGKNDRATYDRAYNEKLDCFYRSDAWWETKKLCGL